MPSVQITQLLRASLEADGLDADDFCQYFGKWKALGEVGEYADYYFGKDGENTRPLRHGRRVLRHVHLTPEADAHALQKWDRDWKRRSRKTSDVCLVYTFDRRHGYLLIFLVREPEGHVFSEMKTKEAAQLMEDFADVADAFQFDGSILI